MARQQTRARALPVLAALLACLAQADEYGGGRMPQYDGAEELAQSAGGDYRGPSPDASASLDYKYEEDSQGNKEKFTKIEQSKSWTKPARNQRGLRHDRDEPRPDEDNPSEETDAAAELFLNSEPRRRRTRGPVGGGGGGGGGGRVRVRPEPARPRRRRPRGRRARARDDDAWQMHGLNADYRVVKNTMLGEDVDTFTSEETTEAIIQRKPRDRSFDNKHVKPYKNDNAYMEQDLISDRRLKGDQLMEPDEMEYEERRHDGGVTRRRALIPPPHEDAGAGVGVRPEEEAEDEGDVALQRARLTPKEYRDYAYYDSKKLPMLVRRTTTRAASDSASTAASSSAAADLLAQLWTARRALPPVEPAPPAPAPDDIDPPHSTTTTSSRNTSESTSELSFAEKSRLSILRKSQKKEHDVGDPSKKPPVLLQVTSKLATIVMVEPPAPSSAEPWLRARRVSGDSPRQLDKVKRLMRHKLVAGARSVQELTDDWDAMVCDYIDVSLLDASGAGAVVAAQPSLPLLTCLTYASLCVCDIVIQ